VHRLAQRLVSDHSKSLADSIRLAHAIGVEPPKDPTLSMLWELKIVSGLSGLHLGLARRALGASNT
jgi:hypothetical protein